MTWHDNAALVAALERSAAACPRATLREVGRTVAGKPILALHVGAGVGDRPQVLVTANLHGNEVIASEAALRLIELLTAAEPPEPAGSLLCAADVTVLPAVNLDAREVAVRALTGRAWWAAAPRGNRHGVDLNRNFPFPSGALDAWHPLAGSRWSVSPWYRGATPLSEPESQAVAGVARALRPAVALALHSAGRLLVHPWCARPDPPAAEAAFQAMGEAFRRAQGDHPYAVKQARAWYGILGDLDDWLYDTWGTLAVTVELGPAGAGVRTWPWRLGSSAAWLNPPDPEPVVAEAALPCLHALLEGVRQARGTPP